MFLLKLPLKILMLPLAAVLIVIRAASVLITGVSSVVTNLIGSLAILTAAGIWMFQLGGDSDAYKMLAFGIALFIAPRAADWIVDKVTNMIVSIASFLMA